MTVLAREIERGILETTVDRLSVADEYVIYPPVPAKSSDPPSKPPGASNKENQPRRDSETTQWTCGSESIKELVSSNSEKYRRYFEAQRRTLENFQRNKVQAPS